MKKEKKQWRNNATVNIVTAYYTGTFIAFNFLNFFSLTASYLSMRLSSESDWSRAATFLSIRM